MDMRAATSRWFIEATFEREPERRRVGDD